MRVECRQPNVELGALPRESWSDVDLVPPDLSPWRCGNADVPGFITLRGTAPGPHLGVVSLIHGNEFAGAIALDRLLRQGLSPSRGTLTFGFAHLDAFDRFDPARPTASRFIDEDLNRVWDPARLAEADAGGSTELKRAAAMLPMLRRFDRLLDLHSMLFASDSLILTPDGGDGAEFAGAIGLGCAIVSDFGHAAGPRMIDHPHFHGPASACLLEAGPHWHRASVRISENAVLGAMRALDMLDRPDDAPAQRPPPSPHARVIVTITARSHAFAFLHPYRVGTVIPRAGTPIARDGDDEICTPCDDCLLVMPTPHPRPGHTAVRLAAPVPMPG